MLSLVPQAWFALSQLARRSLESDGLRPLEKPDELNAN